MLRNEKRFDAVCIVGEPLCFAVFEVADGVVRGSETDVATDLQQLFYPLFCPQYIKCSI